MLFAQFLLLRQSLGTLWWQNVESRTISQRIMLSQSVRLQVCYIYAFLCACVCVCVHTLCHKSVVKQAVGVALKATCKQQQQKLQR